MVIHMSKAIRMQRYVFIKRFHLHSTDQKSILFFYVFEKLSLKFFFWQTTKPVHIWGNVCCKKLLRCFCDPLELCSFNMSHLLLLMLTFSLYDWTVHHFGRCLFLTRYRNKTELQIRYVAWLASTQRGCILLQPSCIRERRKKRKRVCLVRKGRKTYYFSTFKFTEPWTWNLFGPGGDSDLWKQN